MIIKGTTVMKIKTKRIGNSGNLVLFGTGSVAPGTFGSLATLPFVYALNYYWGA